MGENKKKISVIVPCYNVAAFIDRCMLSITEQSLGMDSIEIICIDDASTDDTWSYLQKWEQRFPEDIILIRQEKNRRPGAARNLGLLYASAEWIAYVDADDWLEVDYLELLYGPVRRYECDAVVCRFIRDTSDQIEKPDKRYRSNGKGQYIIADTKEKKKKRFCDGSLGFGPWAKLLRKNLIMENKILFPEGLSYEDMYWLPLLYAYIEKVYVLDDRLYHYYVNPDSTTLCNNASHHMDMLYIQLMKWMDYNDRGLLQEYREELEKDALNDAVCTMTQFIVLYDKPSFLFFQMEREMLKNHISQYRYEEYRADLDQTSRLLLDILYSPLDEPAFLLVIEQVKGRLVK